MLTQDVLNDLFVYYNGALYWRPRPYAEWRPRGRVWVTWITVGGIHMHLGYHANREGAEAAWLAAFHKWLGLGVRAGFRSDDGYRYVRIAGMLFREDKLIYTMHHGERPRRLKHVNGVTDDNRIENLHA